MKPSMKTYQVRSVRDLLAIPNAKLEACLVDLAIWVRLIRSAADVGLKVVNGAGPGTDPEVFGWLDDGRHVASVTIRRGEQQSFHSLDLTEPEPKWIRFVTVPQSPKRKTQVWAVCPKDSTDPLGVITWYGPWRKFVFQPRADVHTVFEPTCLRDIASFIDAHMAERRRKA